MKVVILLGMTLLTAGVALGGPCVSDTAAAYQALLATGCTIDAGGTTLLFNNFTFVQAATVQTLGGSATEILLTPLFSANTAGFQITPIGTFNASVTGQNDIELIFVATVVGGANLITGLNSSVTGTAGASNVGGGLPGEVTLLENFCRGGSLPPGSCPAGQGGTLVDFLPITGPATDVTVNRSTIFEATNSLSILKDLKLAGNNGDIPSSASEVRNVVVLAIPEPSTSLGVALALGVLALFRRVRLQRP